MIFNNFQIKIDSNEIIWLTVRALISVLCIAILPYFLELIPIGDFTTLSSLSIIWVTLLARIFLNEEIGYKFFIFIPLLIMSAVLITRPSILFNNDTHKIDQNSDNSSSNLNLFTLYPHYNIGVLGGILNSISLAFLIIVLRKLKSTPVYLTGLTSSIAIVITGLVSYSFSCYKHYSSVEYAYLFTAGISGSITLILTPMSCQYVSAIHRIIIAQLNLGLFYLCDVYVYNTEMFSTSYIGCAVIIIVNLINFVYK
eukprot:Mrub_09101.p1 GENE.Mrub_09101~~Mrub_09101.p1  ORF type:complete len:255 (+),score=-26.80 Mrub_09101:2-766(+)